MNDEVRFWPMVIMLLVAATSLHLLPHSKDVFLAKPLATTPLFFGSWQGDDLPVEPRIINALGVDDYLNRIYRSQDGNVVGLYVGYYGSQRFGDVIHSPKNCLPGAGWQPVKASYVNLKRPDGGSASVNLYLVQKGLERQFVLYWYQSHGRIIASEYRAKIDLVLDSIRRHRTDSALVRINTAVTGDPNAARQFAETFAQQVMVYLDDVSPK